MFIDVIRLGNPPAEEEVAKASSNTHGNEQPAVEGHGDQHEEITEGDLNNMQERLEKMMPVAETVSRKNEK
jgi:hypothetical protein